jgi:hypothetical protein
MQLTESQLIAVCNGGDQRPIAIAAPTGRATGAGIGVIRPYGSIRC